MFGFFKKFVILTKEGLPYLTRIRVFPWRNGPNIYLHKIHCSDAERELHDHPWAFFSIILFGAYMEHTKRGIQYLDIVNFKLDPSEGHRLELIPDMNGGEHPVYSMVFRWFTVKDWGFYVSGEEFGYEDDEPIWVDHATFLDQRYGKDNWTKSYE